MINSSELTILYTPIWLAVWKKSNLITKKNYETDDHVINNSVIKKSRYISIFSADSEMNNVTY